jgi:hypothetical protein
MRLRVRSATDRLPIVAIPAVFSTASEQWQKLMKPGRPANPGSDAPTLGSDLQVKHDMERQKTSQAQPDPGLAELAHPPAAFVSHGCR